LAQLRVFLNAMAAETLIVSIVASISAMEFAAEFSSSSGSLARSTGEVILGCSRGKANPNQNTRIHLFADSGGYCQNPGCTHELFVDLDSGPIHVAEMAHIFAANDEGPRGNAELGKEKRGAYENLILLCANCHTMIDKAADDFPDVMIRGWKRERVERLAALFGAVHLPSREAVRALIEPLMHENKHILDEYGPEIDARYDPESNGAEIWTRKILGKILPNNRRMLSMPMPII
jgi:hypothetical protein